LNSVFEISKIIKVSVSVISLAFGSADNAYLDLDNSAYVRETVDIYPRANGTERRGTNSARLFTPREREALAKSKVHQ
jgi:hypothetical protein